MSHAIFGHKNCPKGKIKLFSSRNPLLTHWTELSCVYSLSVKNAGKASKFCTALYASTKIIMRWLYYNATNIPSYIFLAQNQNGSSQKYDILMQRCIFFHTVAFLKPVKSLIVTGQVGNIINSHCLWIHMQTKS